MTRLKTSLDQDELGKLLAGLQAFDERLVELLRQVCDYCDRRKRIRLTTTLVRSKSGRRHSSFGPFDNARGER